jgi:hypothetical protein
VGRLETDVPARPGEPFGAELARRVQYAYRLGLVVHLDQVHLNITAES